MNILKLIKKRVTTRNYQNRLIPNKIIKQIIEAGIWGPAIHHWQPWKFVVLNDKNNLFALSNVIKKGLKQIHLPGFIYYPTITTLTNAKIIICVYNTREFSKFIKRFSKDRFDTVKITEVSSISACIQNMLLTAESLGIGSCWLDSPLLCNEKINNYLKTDDELVAILTFGYPAGKVGKRSPRKVVSDTVKLIKK